MIYSIENEFIKATISEKGASRHPKSKMQHQKKRAPWFWSGGAEMNQTLQFWYSAAASTPRNKEAHYGTASGTAR